MTINEKISWKKLQEKVVAVNIVTGVYYTMNSVASIIWTLVADGQSDEQIVAQLTATYPDIDPGTIKADVDEQLAYWKSENLIS